VQKLVQHICHQRERSLQLLSQLNLLVEKQSYKSSRHGLEKSIGIRLLLKTVRYLITLDMCFLIIQISRGIQIICIFQVKSIKHNSKTIQGTRKNNLSSRYEFSRLGCIYTIYITAAIILFVCLCTVTGHVSTATVAQLVLSAIYWKARGKPFSRQNTICIVTISLKFGVYNIIYTVHGGGVLNYVWRRRTASGIQCFWGTYLPI